MLKKNKTPTPLQLISALILMLFIISFSVVLSLNFRPLYYNLIEPLQLEEISGLPREEIKANYNALISYNAIFNRDELRFINLSMSENGRIHFEEVRVIFVVIQYLCIAAFIVSLGLIIYHRRKRLKHNYLRLTAIFTIFIPLILGGLITLNWDKFFVTFHEIFFNNDYWIFDARTDPIILLLPDTFFLYSAIGILIVAGIGSGICLLLSFIGNSKR